MRPLKNPGVTLAFKLAYTGTAYHTAVAANKNFRIFFDHCSEANLIIRIVQKPQIPFSHDFLPTHEILLPVPS